MDGSRNIYLDQDTRLMIKASKGDRDAYSELYSRYFCAVVSFSAAFNGRVHHPEDIAQEVFVRVWENRSKYRPTSTFKTYLFGYAKNVLKENKHLCYGETNVDIDELQDLLSGSFGFEDVGGSEEVVLALKKLSGSLPKLQRQSFELVYIAGLSSAKASEILNCSLNAVHCALHRARRRLRRLLQSSHKSCR